MKHRQDEQDKNYHLAYPASETDPAYPVLFLREIACPIF